MSKWPMLTHLNLSQILMEHLPSPQTLNWLPITTSITTLVAHPSQSITTINRPSTFIYHNNDDPPHPLWNQTIVGHSLFHQHDTGTHPSQSITTIIRPSTFHLSQQWWPTPTTMKPDNCGPYTLPSTRHWLPIHPHLSQKWHKSQSIITVSVPPISIYHNTWCPPPSNTKLIAHHHIFHNTGGPPTSIYHNSNSPSTSIYHNNGGTPHPYEKCHWWPSHFYIKPDTSEPPTHIYHDTWWSQSI